MYPRQDKRQVKECICRDQDILPSEWATLDDLDGESIESYHNTMPARLPENS